MTSPELAARRADVRGAPAGVRQALQAYIPHVELTARYIRLSGIDTPSLGNIVVAPPSAPVGVLQPGTPLVNVPLAFAEDKPTQFSRAQILDEAWDRLDARASDRDSAVRAMEDAVYDAASGVRARGARVRQRPQASLL